MPGASATFELISHHRLEPKMEAAKGNLGADIFSRLKSQDPEIKSMILKSMIINQMKSAKTKKLC